MKRNKLLIIISGSLLAVLILCSCSRTSMKRAGYTMRDSASRTENYMDNGLNSVENGLENGTDTVIGRTYGANSGYSGNAAIGTGTSKNDRAMRKKHDRDRRDDKDNKGEINSNDGNADGGKGSNNNKRK